MKIKKVVGCILITLNIFILSGCWDNTGLKELAITFGIGIEAGSEGKIRVITQRINTTAAVKGTSGSGLPFEKPYRNLVAEGNSVYEALNNVLNRTPSRRYFADTGVIIVSEELARERGMHELLEYFERSGDIRKDVWVLIARGSVLEMLDTPGVLNVIPTRRIIDIVEFQQDNNTFAALKLGEFVRVMESESTQPITAMIEYEPNASKTVLSGVDILSGAVPEPQMNVVINGTAVFKKDKLVDWLDHRESQGLQSIRGETRQGFITCQYGDGSIGTAVVSSRTQIEPVIQNGQAEINIQVEVQSVLEEETAFEHLETSNDVAVLETIQAEKIKQDMEAALQRAQHEYRVDVFGFGEAIHREYPEEWKKLKAVWEEVYPEVEVNIQVKSTIQHTSIITSPAHLGNK